MKFQTPLVTILLLAIAPCFGQKVDLDSKTIPVLYTELPQKPLNKEFKFYSASISVLPEPFRSLGLIESTMISQYLNIPGFKRQNEGGHFHVEVIIDEVAASPGSIKNTSTVSKDKAGKETKTYQYWYEGSLSQNVELKITDLNGASIFNKVLRTAENQVAYMSDKYSTSDEATKNFNINRRRIIASKNKDYVIAVFDEIRGLLVSSYGYKPTTQTTTELEYLDSKSHPSYEAFNKAFETAKTAFAAIKPDQPLDEAAKLMAPAQEYWVKTAAATPTDDKNGKKLVWGCLRNLAVSNFWLEKFDDCVKNCNDIIALDYEPKQAKKMIESVSELKASMEKCQVTSRHMKFEFQQEEAPAEVKFDTEQDDKINARKDQQMGLTDKSKVYDGVMYYASGQKVEGKFVVESNGAEVMDFGRDVRLMKETENRVDRIDINLSKVERFTMGDREFVIKPFKTGTALAMSKSNEIMEVMYKGAKIELYLLHPHAGTYKSSDQIEYILNKTAENDMQTLIAVKFINKKKGLKKYFDECPAMESEIEKADLGSMSLGLIKLARYFEENCGK